MTDPDLENRLRLLLSAHADMVSTQLDGARLRAAAATQQIAPAMHESGEPTGSGDLHPAHREDRIMSIDDLQHDTPSDSGDFPLVDILPARRRGRRLAVVSGAALVAAAAAVVAVAVAPGRHGNGTPAAARISATPTASATTAAAASTGGPYTYVHATFGDGATDYQDVWIPADPTTGTWQLTRKDGQGTITERAACAAFPFFAGANDAPVPCSASAGWNNPYRPPFAESLPTDPKALLGNMRAATGDGTDAETFDLGSGFVESGWLPKDIAGNVLAALRLIPGVTEKPNVANGAGATGTALSYTGRIKPKVPETWGVIVSASGDVIGSTFSYSGKPTEVDSITRTTVATIGARN